MLPARPSFLDARDGILAGLDDQRDAGMLSTSDHQITSKRIWDVFARFGMGPNARSNGASVSGIVADFDPPVSEPTEPPLPDVQLQAVPNIRIPDNQPAGVTSVLSVLRAGRIAGVALSVDIEHTFIGDLRVTLTTPTGSRVILHNRSGASTQNLVMSYRSDDRPGLADLVGEAAQGDWTLEVADLAGEDVGTLRSWRLELDLEAANQVAHAEADPGESIPDNNPTGVSSSLTITPSGSVQGITVSVDITHTFIGDLRVELTTPSGRRGP